METSEANCRNFFEKIELGIRCELFAKQIRVMRGSKDESGFPVLLLYPGSFF
jgi:hypothetical protein